VKTNSRDIDEMLRKCAAAEFDMRIFGYGFTRSSNELRFVRTVNDGTQSLELCYDARPGYKPDALAHLLPRVVVSFPGVNEIADTITEGQKDLVGSTKFTFSQQVQNLSPLKVRMAPPSWFVFQGNTCGFASELWHFLEDWAFPFLRNYETTESLVRGVEASDERLPNDRRFSVIITAAYLQLGQYDKARRFLNERFAAPGLKRKYAKVLKFVSHIAE